MLLAEHFTQSPHWQAYIVAYFFLAGLAGGCYVLGTLLRLRGARADEGLARAAFLTTLVCVLICPILLTVDLGKPDRFWHMVIDTGAGTLSFKPWSPMSLGVYGLTLFAGFAFVSGLDALLGRRSFLAFIARGPVGVVWMFAGSALGLFVGAYTGVLLAVSNQPVWSDGWPLGGLFLASGMSAAAAFLLLISRRRGWAAGALKRADRSFVLIELVALVVFLATVVLAGSGGHLLGPAWILMWLLVATGILAPLARSGRGLEAVAPVLVLLGVLALRVVVVLSAQG